MGTWKVEIFFFNFLLIYLFLMIHVYYDICVRVCDDEELADPLSNTG